MSPSQTHTLNSSGAVVADDNSQDDQDEDDICPVCDRECTCSNPSVPAPSLNPSISDPSSSTQPSKSKIKKIKLSVPFALQHGPVPTGASESLNPRQTTSGYAADGGTSSLLELPAPIPAPKKRGRPRKYTLGTDPRSHKESTLAASVKAISKHSNGITKSYKPKKLVPSRPAAGTNRKRKRRASTSSESSLASTLDDDGRSTIFPTFVSASAMSLSSRSDFSVSDDDDLGFNSDSSIRMEEENFIFQDKERQARIKREREMMYSNRNDDRFHNRSPQNDWGRKKNTNRSQDGHSDADVDTDSDSDSSGSSDSSSDEDGEKEDGDNDNTMDGDVELIDAEFGEDDGVDHAQCRYYRGLATGWSEDSEESSFDADVFFANLSDSSADSHTGDDTVSECGESDQEAFMDQYHALLQSHISQADFGLPFEVTQGWDGQVIFTNGSSAHESFTAFLSLDSAIHSGMDVDVDMSSQSQDPLFNVPSSSEVEASEGGEEADSDPFMESGDDGDTTDEDLIGPDNLPNEKALGIFTLPLPSSESSIPPSIQFPGMGSVHPLSTVSPASSPARTGRALRRALIQSSDYHIPTGTLDASRSRSQDGDRSPSTPGKGPVQRIFISPQSSNNASVPGERSGVIDDQHHMLASPYRKRKISGTNSKKRKRPTLIRHGQSNSFDLVSPPA
jgi:hypothetical protein